MKRVGVCVRTPPHDTTGLRCLPLPPVELLSPSSCLFGHTVSPFAHIKSLCLLPLFRFILHTALEAALTEPNLFFGVDFCSTDGQAADHSEEDMEEDMEDDESHEALEAEQAKSLEA